MMEKQSADKPDSWLKTDWILFVSFIISFSIPLILAWVQNSSPETLRTQSILVGIILALNGLFYSHARHHPSRDNLPQTQFVLWCLYFLILIGLWFRVVAENLWFMFGLYALLPHINRYISFKLATFYNILIALLSTHIMSGHRWNELPNLSPEFVVWFVISTMPLIMLSYWFNAMVNQNIERRKLILQLHKTQTELLAVERHAGVLEERQRLTREIHDTLAQGFTSIVMNLEAAEQSDTTLRQPTQKYLNNARTIARESLEQSRRIITNLQPKILEDASFPDAIRRVVTNWGSLNEIETAVTVTGLQIPLKPDAELALLRAVQESLTNVQKHADAKSVNVTLSYIEDTVMLDVQDDGIGLKAVKKPQGFGLVAMRARLAKLNGSVDIESTPNIGTTVVVTLPT